MTYCRYDGYLKELQDLNIATTYSIALLNLGQAAVFCVGLTSSLLIALHRVGLGTMSVGDLVAVNSMLLQLSIPFNFIGYTYQVLTLDTHTFLIRHADLGYIDTRPRTVGTSFDPCHPLIFLHFLHSLVWSRAES